MTDLPSIAAMLARCPDCNSDVHGPYRDALGIWHITVGHDASCPRYRQMRAGAP